MSQRFQLSDDQHVVMACVDTYEQTDLETNSDLRKYLTTVPNDLHMTALAKLVRVDFERRWKGPRLHVLDYLQKYPELRRTPAVVELLQAEFRFRQRDGEQPDESEYRAIDPAFTTPGDSRTTLTDMPDTRKNLAIAPKVRAPVDSQTTVTEPSETDGAPSPPIPERFANRYRIIKELGSGGFGVVYQACDERLHCDVALKLRRGDRGQLGLSKDQLHEAQAVIKLKHPGIVKVLDAAEDEHGVGYVVYEFVNGETLKKRIARGEYTHVQAAEWVAQVADALHAAHQQQVVHRDIKPANILLEQGETPRVVDFGLARTDGKFYVDDRDHLIGTVPYMSPEQARRDPQWANAQSDIFSLGVVLYELLCKRKPFESLQIDELRDQIQRRDPDAPRSIDASIPAKLEKACLKALEKKPGDRYSNAHDMATAVREAIKPGPPVITMIVRALSAAGSVAALAVIVWLLTSSYFAIPRAPQVTNLTLISKEPVYIIGRPLTAKDGIAIQADFDEEAYPYVFQFEQNGDSKLIWPKAEDLSKQTRSRKLSVADFAHVPNTDGSTLIAVVASREVLSEAELKELAQLRLTLPISVEELLALDVFSWKVSEGCGKVTLGDSIERGPDVWQVPEPFKDKLLNSGGPFAGLLITHKKTTGQPTP